MVGVAECWRCGFGFGVRGVACCAVEAGFSQGAKGGANGLARQRLLWLSGIDCQVGVGD